MSGQTGAENVENTSVVLKGHVLISRTVPKEPYGSLRVEVMEEYLLGTTSMEQKFGDLSERLRLKLIEAGVVQW